MRIQQTILMKRRALFVFLFFEKAAKFATVVCCKLYVALYELTFLPIIVVCWLPLQNLEAATGPLLVAPFCIKWPLAKGRVGHHQHHANGQILDSVFPSEITWKWPLKI